jgi:hydrogenase-4 component B
MTTASIALAASAALLAVAALAVVIGRSKDAYRIVYGLCLALSLVLLAAALTQLLGGAAPAKVRLPLGLPWIGAYFRIDSLSAFFLAVTSLGAAGASLYALGYGRHERDQTRVLPFYPAFLAGMILVVLADDAFSFLLAWEFMSLTSWALVVAYHRESENTRAGYVYLTMASFGTLALLLAFGLLAGPEGGYAFDSIRQASHEPGASAVALMLVLIGAGSKAGLVPLHVWLPLAHPAAPSHVSALMSGVMTKVAIYGFVRIVFDLAGAPTSWMSALVIAVGAATAVLGILFALMQQDIKRILACSTIENVGLIFVNLGLALAFKAQGMNWAAAVAATAALLHVFNHSLFKSLLFFGAGAILHATGERDIEKLGGLIHRMPQTAVAFLVGSVAIAALPPFNGFVSEWLTFQAILLSPQLQAWGLKFLVPAAGALLALAAALAAACFVRLYGIAFLGRARSPAAEHAHETDRLSLAAMTALAALCLIAGIVPGLFIDALQPAVSVMAEARLPQQRTLAWLSIVPIVEERSSYNGLLVFFFIASTASLAAYFIHRVASDRVRRGPAWDCGFPDPRPTTQYSGASFAQPIRRVFGAFAFSANERVEMPPPGSVAPARLTVRVRDLFWDTLYAPLAAGIGIATEQMNRLQFLTIRQYLSLVFAVLVLLLVVLAAWP